MGKNWLIRTKSNHILGPVSKEKVLELYQNGSIKQDDEICSGNGYWFFIRESDLVDRYLLGDAIQTFNPISEAKDVLTSSGSSGGMEPTRDDITMVGGLDLSKVKAAAAPKVELASAGPKNEPDGSQKKKIRSDSQVKQSSTGEKQPRQNYFKYLGYVIFIILALIIYFRKSILRSFFPSETYLRDIPSLFLADAHAQNDSSGKKKTIRI
jgi:hypothetical protein